MRKGIIIGIGTLIILLALAGTVSAHPSYTGMACTLCHSAGGFDGIFFNDTHKFNGISAPTVDAPGNNCAYCHIQPPPASGGGANTYDMSLNSNGSSYNITHRYNATTLGSVKLIGTTNGCDNCHNNSVGNNFTIISGAGTLLSNNTCVYCHPILVADWNLSMHSSQTDPVVNCVTCHLDHQANNVVTTNTSCLNAACHGATNTVRKHGNPGYNITQCKYCHLPKVLTVNTTYDTRSHTWNWTTQLLSGPGDERHEAVFGELKNVTKNDNLTKASCDMCHNYAFAGKVRTSYQGSAHYNASANNVSANAATPYCTDCHLTGNTTEVIDFNTTCKSVACHGDFTHVNDANISGINCRNCHFNNTDPLKDHDLVSTFLTPTECGLCHPKLVDDWNVSLHKTPTKNISAADAQKNLTGNFTPGTIECSICHTAHKVDNFVLMNTTCKNDACHASYNRTTYAITNNLTEHGTPGYNITQCKYCHLPKVLTVNTSFDTASHTWNWTTQLLSSPGDERHEAVFATLKNVTKNDTVTKASCDLCHNYAFAGKVKTSYQGSAHYNASANNVSSNAATPYCTGCHKTANTTEVINETNTCRNSGCHINKNETHAQSTGGATCMNCHFNKSDPLKLHNLSFANADEYNYTCTYCHTANSNISIIPEIDEWGNSLHNKTGHTSSSCAACHQPRGDNKGVSCTICHDIHDMGEWLNKTNASFGVEKVYGWYNRSDPANYTMVDNTTELCGECHYNGRPGRTVPGWESSTSTTPISPHYQSLDMFMGSPKQTGQYGIEFECGTCHIYKNTTFGNGTMNDSDKITGHSFAVNAEALQNTTRCNSCHRNVTNGDGSVSDFRMTTYIENIQNDTQTKWNSTNTTVMNALATINASTAVKGLSRDKIALAYWNLKMVSVDGSMGVHDRLEANRLLDEAAALAIEANASLGMATSNVDLVMGWNLVALNGTGTPSVTAPVDVLSSVSTNITVVWGYNTTGPAWELYDPAMPATLDTLRTMVPGKGYWINAIRACKWTV